MCLDLDFLGVSEVGGSPSIVWTAGQTGLEWGVNALSTGGLAQKAVLPVLGVGEAGAGRGLDLSPEAAGCSPVLARHPLALSTHATGWALDWIGPFLLPLQASLTTPCRLWYLQQSPAASSLEVLN